MLPSSSPPSLSGLLRRTRWSAFEARIILDALAASGRSVAAFARSHGVSPQRIYPWQRRLRPVADTPSELAFLRFVELTSSPTTAAPCAAATTTPAAPRYQISFPTGEVLRIEGPVDRADLDAILAAIRAGSMSC